nr:MAG TPA: hypothetical protein [Caudoviricetes sp.]
MFYQDCLITFLVLEITSSEKSSKYSVVIKFRLFN